MKYSDEIKKAIKESGWKTTQVAKILFKDTKEKPIQALLNKLSRDTIRYSEAKQIAEIIGYEIVWIKKDNQEYISKENEATYNVESKIKSYPYIDSNGDVNFLDQNDIKFLETIKKHSLQLGMTKGDIYFQLIATILNDMYFTSDKDKQFYKRMDKEPSE